MANGAGQVRVDGRLWLVPRLAWTLLYGPIPDDVHVCHRCDTPPCWNPAHLFLGDRVLNMQDMAAKERGNTVKLTARQVRQIRERYALGSITQRELAAQYDVHQETVWKIVNRRSWKAA